MANEPILPAALSGLPGVVRQWLRTARASRGALAAAVALVLAATLAFLYVKTQGADFKKQGEILGYLRELKEIDARWDIEVLRARTEIAPRPAQVPVVDHAADLARIRKELEAAAHEMGSPVLDRSLPGLSQAFAEKADLIAKFRRASAAARQALRRVMGAEAEIAGLMRGTWRSFPDHDRLVAAENVVTHLLAEAQKYFFAPTDTERKNLEALTADLRDAADAMPLALKSGMTRLDGNVQQLLGAKPVEQDLFNKLAFLTAGPRVDSLTKAFSREVEQTLTDRERYRAYLIAYSGALLILIGYLASRLFASYRLLNEVNAALKAANEGLEQRVAERTQELTEALHRLKESEAQLIQTEKMSSLGQMVAGVAHEINTPLAYVKNSLGSVRGKLPGLSLIVTEGEKLLALLQASNTDPHQLSRQFALMQTLVKQIRQQQALEELQALIKDGLHGIGRISELVVNLKNFSRLDRSKVASFDLNEGLDSTLLLAMHEIKKLTVKKHYSAIPPITCSPSQINQVFLNLINNAAQAIESGSGVITLTTRSVDPEHVAVDVEDNGKGIPPEVLPRIFDPFFTTKDIGKGTGLGLSIVYKIVEQHGGKITVDSGPGAGTKFTVMLPLTPPDPAEPAA